MVFVFGLGFCCYLEEWFGEGGHVLLSLQAELQGHQQPLDGVQLGRDQKSAVRLHLCPIFFKVDLVRLTLIGLCGSFVGKQWCVVTSKRKIFPGSLVKVRSWTK